MSLHPPKLASYLVCSGFRDSCRYSPRLASKERTRTWGTVGLADVFAPAFQCLLHKRHELVGDGAVD
jgi:hypothetical protein